MKPIKKSGSGLLLHQNINLFKFGNTSSVAYNKNQEKTNRLEFELEKQKEIIVKLQLELNEKQEELNKILKTNKKRKNIFQKTIKLIEQILKICDKKEEKEIEFDNKNDNELKEKIETIFNCSLYKEQSKKNLNLLMLKMIMRMIMITIIIIKQIRI